MSIAKKFEKSFKRLLPAPFTIAVLLTFFTVLLALLITEPKNEENHFIQILFFWEQGVWNSQLLVFAIQMMLMLVLGHTLALSKPIIPTHGKELKLCITNKIPIKGKLAAIVSMAS